MWNLDFKPPQVIQARVLTHLPEQFRAKSHTEWGDANKPGILLDSFLEGPSFDRAGNLYVTDIPFGRVFRIAPDLSWRLVAEYDGWPNGTAIHRDGSIWITDYRRGLLCLDVDGGNPRTLLGHRNSESFKGVNDLTFDAQGRCYFTDQGQTGLHDPTGRVYRLGTDGRLDLLLSNAPSPNGVVLSADEKFLFVAMTRGNCVWRMPIMADGSVSKAGQFFTSYGPSGPDGLAMDRDGRLIVCNPGLGVAWVLDARAEPVEILRAVPGTSLTNVAFGGPQRRTAYFTDSTHGRILKAEMTTAGCPVNRR
jgi:gluconolactonase